MTNVVRFTGVTRLHFPPAQVLEEASEVNWEDVVVIGLDKDGSERFFSSTPDGGDVIWLLERIKLRLLTVFEGD